MMKCPLLPIFTAFCLDVLGNELGDIDSSDEKLQKLLETSIGDDGTSASATVGSFLSALLSQQVRSYVQIRRRNP